MAAAEIVAVLDAGPLLHLDELGSLKLLDGYREVLLPEVVADEARRHRPEIQLDSIPGLVRVQASSATVEPLLDLAAEFGLHAGELAAIAVLKEHHGHCLLSDDTAARAMAEAVGFQVRGTVGLIRALPERSTLHLNKPALLETILQRIKG